jgi:hypothetical protein
MQPTQREISELYEIYTEMGKNGSISFYSWCDSEGVRVIPFNSGGQWIESCQNEFFFLLWFFLKFPKDGGLNAFGNFRREEG